MHITVLFHDLMADGPVWRNGYWPLIDVLSRLGGFQLVEAPWQQSRPGNALVRAARSRIDLRRTGQALAAGIRLPDEPEAMIFTIALNAGMVAVASDTIDRLPDNGSRKVLYIDENIEPGDVQPHHWRSFDRIVCFCSELAAQIEAGTGVPTSYWPPHLDLLAFHSTGTYRPVDLICFGRSRTDILFEMQRRFLDPAASAMCMDFVTRTQSDRTQPAEAEFRLLFDNLSKSRATLCYPPDDVPRFKGRSPLLARWVYAWAAGCAVFGARPKSAGAQPHLDWAGSMVELPDNVAEAGDVIENTLADAAALRDQSLVNTSEALMRHDTRYRLLDLFGEVGLTVPDSLERDIQELSRIAATIRETVS